MAWTELHDTLPDHPKVKHLAAELGCTKGHAIGVVVSLWCHTLRYGKAGEIRLSYVRGLLADIGGTDVDGALGALRLCGWIDQGDSDQTIKCHDWDDYAGRLEVIRERDRQRKQAERAELKRLRKVSEGHPKDVRKSPVESAQPNPTKPNQTKPNTLGDSGESPAEKYPPGFVQFWSHYPRKVGKGAAFKVWKRMTRPDKEAAIDKAEWFAGCWKHHDPHGERASFIPHPATWLNGRRWEDEDSAVELAARGK